VASGVLELEHREGCGMDVGRVESYAARRPLEGGGSVPCTVLRCQDCGAELVHTEVE
jgi:hypothetical protein